MKRRALLTHRPAIDIQGYVKVMTRYDSEIPRGRAMGTTVELMTGRCRESIFYPA